MRKLFVQHRGLTRWLPHGGALVLQVASLLAFGGSFAAIHGFPLDDAWIHQVVARTFAETGTLGYAVGHHGAGATSYLWAALLATNFLFLHVDPVIFTLVLNLAFTIAAAQCLLVLLLRGRPDGHDEGTWKLKSVCVTGLATLGGNYLWFAFSGMEASLFVFLSLLAITLFVRALERRGIHLLLAGVCAGALALTRPEGALLGPMLALWSLRARRGPREMALFLAPWSAGIAIYVGSNLYATGTALPATLAGRRWLWLEDSGLGWGWLERDFGIAWLSRLRNYTLGTSSNVAFWIANGCFVLGLVRVVRGKSQGLKLVLTWTLAHLAAYAVMLPTPGHAGRYQPLTPLVYLALVGLGAIDLTTSLVRGIGGARFVGVQHLVAMVAGTVPWIALVSVGVRDWRDDHARAVAHVRETEVGLGRIIDSLPEGAHVASFDIGGSGFFAHRSLLDLGGLVDAAAVPLMKEGRIWEYLRDHAIDYVVLPSGYFSLGFPDPVNFGQRLHLFENPALELTLVRVLGTDPAIWASGAASTANAAPKQMVFRVEYTGRTGPSRPPPPRDGVGLLEDPQQLVSARDREAITHGLDVLAGYGMKVLLRFTAGREEEAARPDQWLVRVGPGGGVATPPHSSLAPAAAVTGLISEWIEYYVDAEDWGGAGRMSLYALAESARRFDNPLFLPMLPPADAVKANDAPPETTLGWGLPLAALALALGLLVGVSRRFGRLGVLAVAASLLAGCGRRLPDLAVDGDSVLRAMLERGRANVDERVDGRTALHVASGLGDAGSIRVLLAHHANVAALDGSGDTALIIAATVGRAECVDALLAGGANPNQPNRRNGLRPLDAAVLFGTPESQDRLLRGGADPNATNLRGETALHHAAKLDSARSTSAAVRLLRHGANPYARDARGFTPLHVAAARDNAAFVRLYKELKLDLNAPSAWGDSPFDVATAHGSDLAGDALFAAGAEALRMPPAPPLLEASRTNDVARLARLLAAGADREQSYGGKTARDVAREAGSDDAMQLLGPSLAARDAKH